MGSELSVWVVIRKVWPEGSGWGFLPRARVLVCLRALGGGLGSWD